MSLCGGTRPLFFYVVMIAIWLAAVWVQAFRCSVPVLFWPRAPNQRSEPCRRRALVRAVRTAQLPHANRATEYRHRSARLISTFDIGQRVRISGTTGALGRQDIR
jgi:hypothetical protein